jgi:hypothetical protein
MEHIPSYIFDWIESKHFDSLTESQRHEVTAWMTKEEYNELHRAAAGVKELKEEQPQPAIATREALLTAFDKRYIQPERQAKSIFFYSVPLWKVAAVFLLFGGGALWIILETRFHNAVSYITIKDTVYVPSYTANDETIKVKDTVYLPGDGSGKRTAKKTVVRHRVTVVSEEKLESTTSKVASLPGTNSSFIKDKDALSNKPKGNSLKDDTLLQKFRFIGL